MLDNPLLNICIGLVFFYLLLSIIVTTLQEVIAGILNWRGRNLMKAIDELIAPGDIKEKFFRHPLIFPLFKGDLKEEKTGWQPAKPPAYIPARSFAMALSNVMQGANNSRTANPGAAVMLAAEMASAQPAAPALPSAEDPVVQELERLYDSAVERAAGWYKRWAMYVSLVLGLLISTALNADSIHIARQLWNNPTLSKAVAQAAENFSNAKSGPIQASCVPSGPEANPAPPPLDAKASAQNMLPAAATSGADAASVSTSASVAKPAPSATSMSVENVCSATLADFRQHLDELTAVGFPIGWAKQTSKVAAGWWRQLWTEVTSIRLQPDQQPISAIPGILLTTIAIGLGSNFWFDVLDRFMNFRSAGKREKTMEEKAG